MDTTYSVNGQRQTNAHNYVKLIMLEKKPKTTPQKTSGLLMEPEKVTEPKTPPSSMMMKNLKYQLNFLNETIR